MADLTALQDQVVIIENPVGIDKAVNEIRLVLAGLSWISHPFHIAQRFYKKVGSKGFYLPQTYIVNPENPNLPYHPLTPDNKYKGMFFFMVGPGKETDDKFTTYQVAAIFSVNLELINAEKLKNGSLFTQELIGSAKKAIRENQYSFEGHTSKLVSETRDQREVYREFVLDETQEYNRAPLQCFRIEMSITVDENEC